MEPTDEMIRAYADASWEKPVWTHGAEFPNVRDGLAAVLAIVERDRKAEAERDWDALEQCPSPDPDGTWMCEGELGHDGPHRALRWLRTWP